MPVALLGVRHHERALRIQPHKMRVKTYEVTLEAEEDPSIETYQVTLEKDLVMLHV